jgi:hypothetical protein
MAGAAVVVDIVVIQVMQLLVDQVGVGGLLMAVLLLDCQVLVELMVKVMLGVMVLLEVAEYLGQVVVVVVLVLLDCRELHKLHREMVEQELLVI